MGHEIPNEANFTMCPPNRNQQQSMSLKSIMNINLVFVASSSCTSSNFQYLSSARPKKRIQPDLRFCENEWSRRFKINEKGGQLHKKLKVKWIQNALNLLNNTFWWNIRPYLGPSICGTKCDRDKLIIFCRKRGQSDCVEVYNRNPVGLKIPKMGVITT